MCHYSFAYCIKFVIAILFSIVTFLHKLYELNWEHFSVGWSYMIIKEFGVYLVTESNKLSNVLNSRNSSPNLGFISDY